MLSEQQDPLVLAVGLRMLANTAWWQGELADAQEHSRRGLALYRVEQYRASDVSYGQDSGVCCGWIGALSLWVLGYPDQAVDTMAKTMARARELAHPLSVAQTLLFSAKLSQLRREPQAALAQADDAIALCTEQGLDAYGVWSFLPRGWAIAQLGQAPEGIADIRKALDGRLLTTSRAVLPWFWTLLGEAHGIAGQIDEGLHAVGQALHWVVHNDEHLYEAEVHRTMGELLLKQRVPDAAQAEACFRQALDDCSSTAGQVVGAASGGEPEPALAAARETRRCARAAGALLRLVHRGLRDRRLAGGQGTRGRAVIISMTHCRMSPLVSLQPCRGGSVGLGRHLCRLA